MNLVYGVVQASVGWIGLLASTRGMRRVTLPQTSSFECIALLGSEVDNAVLSSGYFVIIQNKLSEYFRGEAVDFGDIAIDAEDASPFARAIWDACRSIPSGDTRSYKWLARQAGKPGAQRATGQALARNRLPLIVPCHRVISSDGSLQGFGGGLSRVSLKQWLIDLERSAIA